MNTRREHFRETHLVGAHTRVWTVRANTSDRRPFLASSPVCAALGRHQIAHVGAVDAAVPFRIVRTKQSGTYFLACFGGEGRVLVDGRWRVCRAGTADLMPSGILNAFHAIARTRWQFCWVRYDPQMEQRPLVLTSSPVLARFDAEPLRAAILGLHHECAAQAGADAVDHWVELIQTYALRFARPWQTDRRLLRLWERVGTELSRPWTLPMLARQSGLSSEHLRRLCRQQLGRSPMHHVIHLRMRRATELLVSTDDKVETIAAAVGYQNPFAFSTTFKKWIGWRPSEHRSKQALSHSSNR
jgi:AraC-like DNA-binding protein